MKVNMTPNPLDVVTIHASQGDTEARQWEFELHNNGELVDTSDVKEQMVFKSYKGGTEQLLPENGSTPTTSPFNGDIKYPQGLLTDQEFLYRQSPTEEDGLAKITDIKGNTLVLNQLWDYENISFQQGLTVTKPGNGVYLINGTRSTSVSGDAYNILKAGHKYLIKSNTDNGTIVVTNSITWQTTQSTYILNATADGKVTYFINPGTYTNVKFIPQVIDLTQMFGQGNEPTTVEEFTSLFPLSYYAYNQGTLLSFNGNGIKTVGFNLFDQDSVLTNVGFVKQSDGSFYIQYPSSVKDVVLFENKLKYSGQFFLVYKYKYESTTGQGCRFEVHYTDGAVDQLYAAGSNDFVEVSFISKANKVLDYINATYGSNIGTWWKDVCINFSDTERNGTYEPYTSSTLSLPISTYFPTGMKSAGTVYDELTPTKAITRIGAVDLGSLSWSYNDSFYPQWPFFVARIDSRKRGWNNIVCSKYPLTSDIYSRTEDKVITGVPYSNPKNIIIRDSSYTDATAFTQAMNGVYLYYELATPTETSFTTASLVTENAEIQLSNEDGILIGKCTEQLSSESGFFDAKIKLSDSDGTCYSNKLQLHVERSPQ